MMITRLIRRQQFGFSLIEVIIVMGISALIVSSIGAVIYQVFTNNMRNRAHMTAVKEAENALHFMVRDIQMAQTVQTSGLTGDQKLRLVWVDWDNTTYVVVYSLSNGVLTRSYSQGATTSVSRYIASCVVTPQPYVMGVSGFVTVNISARVGTLSQPESREIKVFPRAMY